MSAAHQGFILSEGRDGLFVPVTDVSDLRTEYYQDLLERHHYSKKPPYCSCGVLENERRTLHVHTLPLTEVLSLYCKDANEHTPHCWRRASGDGQDDEFTYSSAIFRMLPGQDIVLCSGDISGAVARLEYAFSRFGRFAAHVLSGAQLNALVAGNLDWRRRGFLPTTSDQLFLEIHRELRRCPFPEGTAYAAARAEGAELCFGIVSTDAFAAGFSGGAMINAWWWTDGCLCHETVVVEPSTWSSAIAGVRVFGRLQPAPYLCFAVREADGRLRRLRLFPCFSDGRVLTPAESGYENGFAAHVNKQILCGLKPVLRGDTTRLFELLDLWEGQVVPNIYYRPDYVILERMPNGMWRVFIVEIRGFKPGQFPAYDAHLTLKKEYFSALHPRIRFVERDGWDYARSAQPAAEIDWQGLPIEWLGPSLVARTWRAKGSR